jgi:hypothetical protein
MRMLHFGIKAPVSTLILHVPSIYLRKNQIGKWPNLELQHGLGAHKIRMCKCACYFFDIMGYDIGNVHKTMRHGVRTKNLGMCREKLVVHV